MVLEEVEEFVREYFDQNPISQLSLVLMRDAVAPVLTQLAGNPSSHIATLKESYRWVSMRVWSGGREEGWARVKMFTLQYPCFLLAPHWLQSQGRPFASKRARRWPRVSVARPALRQPRGKGCEAVDAQPCP